MAYRYDVIIVGGGPAGATAAFFLSQAGASVLILEGRALPRYKVCGGGIPADILQQFPFSFEPVIESRVQAITYALPRKAITLQLPESPLCMVMRADFDAFLLEHVRAEVRDGNAVRRIRESSEGVVVETASGERIEADYVVGADGANSIVARALGLRRKRVLAAAIEVEAAVPDEALERFRARPVLVFGEIGLGYLWIFPKANHLSVGIGALHPRPRELQSVLERVMPRFGIRLEGQPHRGHVLPIFSGAQTLATAHTLLAGDAAGLVDPFTGEGIRFAIKSGRLAAEAILNQQVGRYSAAVQQFIGRHHAAGAALTFPFYRMPQISFELGLRNPVLTDALMDMLADRYGYGTLAWHCLRSFPAFILGRLFASSAIPALEQSSR